VLANRPDATPSAAAYMNDTIVGELAITFSVLDITGCILRGLCLA